MTSSSNVPIYRLRESVWQAVVGARSLRTGIGTLALALALGAMATPSRALEKVVFGVPTVTSVSFSMFFTAKQAGFLKDEGLELEILNFKGSGVVASLLVTGGRLTVGWLNPGWLIRARQPGKDPAPIKFYYNQNRTTVWEYVVPEDSSITSFRDLKGKVLGMPNLSAGTLPITRAMLSTFGVDNSEYEVVAVGLGMPAYRALNTGRIDILGAIVPIRARMSAEGMKLRLLDVPKTYATLPSVGVAAHEEVFKEKPQVLVGFARAIAKATVFCEANKEACIRAYWKEEPEAAPAAVEETKQMEVNKQILTKYLSLQMRLPLGDESLLGQYSDRIWREYIGILHGAGQIEKTDLAMDSLYTDEFLLEINDFDAEAVRALAREWKGW